MSACAESSTELTESFTVVYVDDEGRLIATYDVLFGEDAPIPEDPKKEGYTFEGWSQIALNVSQNLEIKAQFAFIKPELEPTVLVLTYLEGAEAVLEDFFDISVKIVRSLEGIDIADYVRLLVLYEDQLIRDVEMSKLGAPNILIDQFVTFLHPDKVDTTVIYLENLDDFIVFFETFNQDLFSFEGILNVYDFYPVEGITVYDASSMFEVQPLLERLEGAKLARSGQSLKWFYLSEEIYVFLGETIPSFLTSYADQINALNNQVIEIITERNQRLIVGRSYGEHASEYYQSFLDLVETGIEGSMRLPGYRPERLSFPQNRIASSDVCYTEELRGLRFPVMLPYETTVTHDIPLGRLPSMGTITGLNVMISFHEYPSSIPDDTLRSYIQDAIATSDAFFDEMSGGRISFEWIYYPEVIVVPFFLDENITPENPDFQKRIENHIALVVSIVEETIDLTPVELINFYWAPGLPDYVYGGLSALLHEPMETQRGAIYNYNVKKFEMRYIDDPVVFAANTYHGIAHNFGLTDLYIQQWIPEFSGKPPVYKYGNWDVMTAAINELNGWHRWILSWINDDQVHCIPPTRDEEYEVFIEPLNENDGETRLIVIPLSETEALYIELRGSGMFCPSERWRSFSYPWLQGGCTQNILVTHVNTMAGNGHGPKQIIRPERSIEEDYSDALLLEGEFVTFSNITITHSERYGSGSVINIRFGE